MSQNEENNICDRFDTIKMKTERSFGLAVQDREKTRRSLIFRYISINDNRQILHTDLWIRLVPKSL